MTLYILKYSVSILFIFVITLLYHYKRSYICDQWIREAKVLNHRKARFQGTGEQTGHSFPRGMSDHSVNAVIVLLSTHGTHVKTCENNDTSSVQIWIRILWYARVF